MDAPSPKKYLSRFSNEPAIAADGKPVVITSRDLTDYDIRALATLIPRRFQHTDSIARLIGGYPKHVRDRFAVLKRKPNAYVKLADEQANNPKQYLRTKLFYELTERGIMALEERGYSVPPRRPAKQFIHQVMIDEIIASWQIGFNENSQLTPIWWDEIKTSEKTPAKTRAMKAPHQIPVRFRFDAEYVEKLYVADDRPFGFLRADRKGYFFPGIEADCDSESVRSDHYTYSSIKRKVAQQIAILEQELYRSHFGFPNMFFLYYLPTERRLLSVMDVVAELTDHRPSLRKSFAFAVHPTITNYEQVEPSDWALTREYRRVEYDPLNFLK